MGPWPFAGEYPGVPLLGTIQKGAPADMIAIPGSVINRNIKALEFPDFVISGGIVVMNHPGPKRASIGHASTLPITVPLALGIQSPVRA